MNERVKEMYELVLRREYRKERTDNVDYDLTQLYLDEPALYGAAALEDMLGRETPFLLDGDIFGFNRRNVYCPHFYLDGKKVTMGNGNVAPNYAEVIRLGFGGALKRVEICERENASEECAPFYRSMKRYILAVTDICRRYESYAAEVGNQRLAEALSRVVDNGAESFYEACLLFKIIVYTLRAASHTHVTIGRFDQYMYPYFKRDVERGVSEEEIFETLELLFISLNVDSDIYFGAQQGDNGQSMVLGGYDKDGNDTFNELSRLCLIASRELKMIDPKINLRVSKKTPIERYELGTSLTKQGLGFPQYCNDDVIVPYMISMGYDEEDAYNYAVAACWEVIPQGNCADVTNASSCILPAIVNEAIFCHLCESESFDALMVHVGEHIKRNADEIIERARQKLRKSITKIKNSYLSLFTDGCLEKGRDIFDGGAKYHNYGTHGAGISNAADALCAVKIKVFDEGSVRADELIEALKKNFVGYGELRNTLLACPKMGNNEDAADLVAAQLIELYAAAFNGRDNGVGGVWRAGSGSAQSYATHASEVGATADGRLACDYFACSFSPAITTRLKGPLSVIQSFTKFDLKKICNGGPLTMELHDSVFRNAEGEKKVAALAKLYIDMGGHQLQLNSVNRDILLEAKREPEKYRNLIVRVWGWSGYFCELEEKYREHIIRRTEFSV